LMLILICHQEECMKRQCAIIVYLFFVVIFLGTSFYYQYFRFQDYSQKALANSLESVFLEAPRGLISDKFNNNLADNQIFTI